MSSINIDYIRFNNNVILSSGNNKRYYIQLYLIDVTGVNIGNVPNLSILSSLLTPTRIITKVKTPDVQFNGVLEWSNLNLDLGPIIANRAIIIFVIELNKQYKAISYKDTVIDHYYLTNLENILITNAINVYNSDNYYVSEIVQSYSSLPVQDNTANPVMYSSFIQQVSALVDAKLSVLVDNEFNSLYGGKNFTVANAKFKKEQIKLKFKMNNALMRDLEDEVKSELNVTLSNDFFTLRNGLTGSSVTEINNLLSNGQKGFIKSSDQSNNRFVDGNYKLLAQTISFHYSIN